MAGRRELGFPKGGGCSLREQLARTTLRNVRSQGHACIELREDGKRIIFFCTLCLAPCYSDSVLFDHLKGNLHTERYAAAKATLLKSNPFPFNDGVHFFHDSPEEKENTQKPSSNDTDDENRLAIVRHGENSSLTINGQVSQNGFVSDNSEDYSFLIPRVLHRDEVSDLEVRFLGLGQIAARVYEKDGVSNGIRRIWCEWIGKKDYADDVVMIPEHDFAVVTFPYNYDLGRKGLIEDVKYLLLSSPQSEKEECLGAKKKQRSLISDVEDVSESLSNQSDSSGEDSLSSTSPNSKLVLHGYDDQLLHSRVILSKTLRKELRRQQRVASERMCDICQHKMLPGKDVATLLNKKTGKLACSSRNVNGAFHVYHISCLVHWILLCEMELCTKQSVVVPEVKRRSRRKTSTKTNKKGKKGHVRATRKQMNSVFCPECQGTGVNIDGDELEKPTVPLSEMFRYKIKVSDARRAWMKCPEVLENCSTGFHFPSQSEEETIQEKVSPLKLLHFYRADE